MPTYAYRGTACEHAFDVYQSFTDEPLTTCPECGGPVRKVLSPVGVVFKGSGFYRTDSREKSRASTGSSSRSSESTSDSKTSTSGSSDSSSSTGTSTSGSSASSSGTSTKPAASSSPAKAASA